MRNYFLGIDIGLSGGITLLNEYKEIISCSPIPTISVLVNKKIRKQYDISAIYDIIKELSTTNNINLAGLERLRAIPNQNSQTAFSMGGGSMLFKTIFTILKIPFIEFEPRSWQKEIFGKLGVQYNKDTTKEASIQTVKLLFPGYDFKPTARCTKYSDGMTDSACIALYTKIISK